MQGGGGSGLVMTERGGERAAAAAGTGEGEGEDSLSMVGVDGCGKREEVAEVLCLRRFSDGVVCHWSLRLRREPVKKQLAVRGGVELIFTPPSTRVCRGCCLRAGKWQARQAQEAVLGAQEPRRDRGRHQGRAVPSGGAVRPDGEAVRSCGRYHRWNPCRHPASPRKDYPPYSPLHMPVPPTSLLPPPSGCSAREPLQSLLLPLLSSFSGCSAREPLQPL